MKRTNKVSLAVAAALAAAGWTSTASYGQINLTGTSYLEDFDDLATAAPEGLTLRTMATSSALGNAVTYTATPNDPGTAWSSSTGSFKNYASASIGASATGAQQAAATDRAIGIRQTSGFGDPGAAFEFTVANTAGFKDFSLSLDLEMLSVQQRATTWTIDYRIGTSGNFTMLDTYSDPAVFGITTKNLDLTGITALNNQSDLVTFRVVALGGSVGSNSRDTFGIDNFQLNYTAIPSNTVTRTWDGDGAAGSNPSDVSGTWDDAAANWLAAGAHSAWSDAAGDNAVFGSGSGATGTTTVTVSGARTAGRITFAANSPTYTLTGGQVTVKGDLGTGIAASNSATIDSDLVLDGTQQTVSVANGNTLTVSGQVSGGVLSKTGDGTLALTDNTNAHASTRIVGGAVQISDDGQLGAAAAPVALAGGSLQFTGPVTLARPIQLDANGTVDTGAATVTAPSVTGAGRLIKAGAGTLVLAGGNSYAGGTTLGTGTIETQATNALGTGALLVSGNATLQTTSDLTVAGGISGTAVLTKTGAGTLSVGGTSPANAGGSIVVNAGKLEMTSVGGLGGLGGTSSPAMAITLNPGTELLTNFGSTSFRANGSITLNSATITRPNGAPDNENQFDTYASTTVDVGGQVIVNGNSTIQSLDVATGTGAGTESVPSNSLAFRMPVHVNSGATLTVHSANNVGDYGSNAVAFRGTTQTNNFPNDAFYIHDGATVVMSGPGEKRFGAGTTGKPIIGQGTSAAAEATLKLDGRTFLTDIAGTATRNISKLVVNGSGTGGLRIEAPMNATYNVPAASVPNHPDPTPDGTTGLFGLNTTETREGGAPPAGYFPIGNAYTVMSPKRYAQLSDPFGSPALTPGGTLTLAATDAAGATGRIDAGPAAPTALGLALDNAATSGNLVYEIDPAANGGTFRNFARLAVQRTHGSVGSVTAKLLGTTKIADVAVTGGAKLDLVNQKLVTNTPVGTAGAVVGNTRIYDGLQGLVQSAKNGDLWNGPGLTSSVAATEGGLTTIGIANGAQAKGGIGATETALWGGETITGSSILAMYTYAGDANLDGAITGDDYSAIDFGILFEGMDGYANGDFNYDGYVTGDDYSVIDLNILLQGPQIPTGGAVASSAVLSGVTAVPEPSACGFALLAAASALTRRRRAR